MGSTSLGRPIDQSGVAQTLARATGHDARRFVTLAVQARLRLLERTLLPLDYSVVNLFTDFLIDERLNPVVGIHRVFDGHEHEEADPAVVFWLAVHEELGRLDPGTLMGQAAHGFDHGYPGYRAHAQLLAQDLFRVGPNPYVQFICFVTVLARYLESPAQDQLYCPGACGRGEPSAEDWAEALTPSPCELEAIQRALKEGWIGEAQAQRMLGDEGMARRIDGLPDQQADAAELVPEIMASYYRQQAERYLAELPHGRSAADVEIYLDVSSSLPDPLLGRNLMTLAALILTIGAIRGGGRVRALLYSHTDVRYWRWCRSAVEMSRFLMHYIGGGTEFPFAALKESVEQCRDRQPVRLIFTDADFDAPLDADAVVLADAVRASPHCVLLLHAPNPERVALYHGLGARVEVVEQMEDFPQLAADLARALFGGDGLRRGCRHRGNPRRHTVALADWFSRRRDKPPPPQRVDIDLAALVAHFTGAVPRLENQVIDPDWLRARLDKHCRDAQVAPLVAGEFAELVSELSAEALQRLALALGALDLPSFPGVLARLAASHGGNMRRVVERAFVGLAVSTPLLTMELLRHSALRREEFARHFIDRLPAAIQGETAEEARQQLARLDYGRLLAEAEQAKAAAADRLEFLRKLHEEQDRRRPRERRKGW